MIGEGWSMNKKGFIIEGIAFVIIGIILVAFFALMIYGFNLINTQLTSGRLSTSAANVSYAASLSFSKLSSGMQNLKSVAIAILIGYLIATLLTAYFSTRHPIWIVVYILISAIVIIFSFYISNAYAQLKTNAVIGSIFTGFSAVDFVVNYLPAFTTILFLAGILLCIVGSVISRRMAEGL
jgi:hypothetical protein